MRHKHGHIPIENNDNGGRHGRRHHDGQLEGHSKGAKTFRRGRILTFLEKLESDRATLKRQLETPELQSIQQVLVGELKATESIIDEFKRLFELQEDDLTHKSCCNRSEHTANSPDNSL